MAKKKKSAYERNRQKLQRRINSLHKQGYELNYELPPTHKQLNKHGIKGSQIVKLNNEIKNVLNELDNYEVIDAETGEIKTYQYIKDLNKQINKIEKENERRFWSGEEQIPVPERLQRKEPYRPDGGEVIYNNVYDNYLSKYERVDEEIVPSSFSEFEAHVNSSVPTTVDTSRGKPRSRNPVAVQASSDAIDWIKQVLDEEVQKRGKSSVGWSIEQNADILGDLSHVMYGSSSAEISQSASKVVTALRQEPVSQQLQKDLSDQLSYFEDYDEEYDDEY